MKETRGETLGFPDVASPLAVVALIPSLGDPEMAFPSRNHNEAGTALARTPPAPAEALCWPSYLTSHSDKFLLSRASRRLLVLLAVCRPALKGPEAAGAPTTPS